MVNRMHNDRQPYACAQMGLAGLDHLLLQIVRCTSMCSWESTIVVVSPSLDGFLVSFAFSSELLLSMANVKKKYNNLWIIMADEWKPAMQEEKTQRKLFHLLSLQCQGAMLDDGFAYTHFLIQLPSLILAVHSIPIYANLLFNVLHRQTQQQKTNMDNEKGSEWEDAI